MSVILYCCIGVFVLWVVGYEPVFYYLDLLIGLVQKTTFNTAMANLLHHIEMCKKFLFIYVSERSGQISKTFSKNIIDNKQEHCFIQVENVGAKFIHKYQRKHVFFIFIFDRW